MNFTKIILILCGLVHLMPVIGILGTEWLERLYGINISSQDTLLLLQHRALLFAIVAIICFQGALKNTLRSTAAILVMISMGGYILLVGFENNNPHLVKVLWVDIALFIPLFISWLRDFKTPK